MDNLYWIVAGGVYGGMFVLSYMAAMADHREFWRVMGNHWDARDRASDQIWVVMLALIPVIGWLVIFALTGGYWHLRKEWSKGAGRSAGRLG